MADPVHGRPYSVASPEQPSSTSRASNEAAEIQRVPWLPQASRKSFFSKTTGKSMPSSIANKAYGTVTADRQNEMSGLEFVRGARPRSGALPLNTIAQTLGYDVDRGGQAAASSSPRDPPRTAPQPRWRGAWRLGGDAARQLHGPRHPFDPGQGRRSDDRRVQDFAGAADHAGDGFDQGQRASS